MPPSSADSSAARAPRAASPSAHVLHGESEAVPAAVPPSSSLPAVAIANPESADRDRDVAGLSEGSDDNNGKGKRTAWSLPSNLAMAVGPVMGAVSWPALGESGKAPPKLSPSDTIKSGSDGSSSSVTPPQVTVVANLNHNHHQMRVNSNSPNPNSNRPRPNKRGGGSGSTSSNHGSQGNGGPVSSEMLQQIVPEKPTANGREPSPRDMHNIRNNSNWDHGSSSRGSSGFSPHSHSGSDRRPFNRRGNNGGGGPHYGGRHDSERGGYSNHSNGWNNPLPRHILPPPQPPLHHHGPQFIRPPPPPPLPGSMPFIGPPPPGRSFVAPPMGFPAEIPSPLFYVPGHPPFIAAPPVAHAVPPAMLLNHADSLRTAVLKQIEYYFSDANLCKDVYLRSHMDKHGWVLVDTIAKFNRVISLTNNIPDSRQYILDVLRTSEVVEVQDGKIRRRGKWKHYVLHSQTIQHGSSSSPHAPAAPNSDSLVDHMQKLMIEDRASNQSTGGATVSEVGRLASGNFVEQLRVGGSNDDKVCMGC